MTSDLIVEEATRGSPSDAPAKGNVSDFPPGTFSDIPESGNVSDFPPGTFSPPVQEQETLHIPATGRTYSGPFGWLVSAIDEMREIDEVRRAALGVGEANKQLSHLYFKQLRGQESPELTKKISVLEEQAGKQVEAEGIIQEMFKATSTQVPQLIEVFEEGGKGAVAGAVIGVGVALVAGQVTPGAAFAPEEAVTVPFGARKGAQIGGGLKAGNVIFETSSGNAFHELSQIKGLDGENIDPTVAKIAAYTAGAAITGMEAVPVGKMIKLVPGSDIIFKKIGAKSTDIIKIPFKKFASRATKAQAIKTFAKNIATVTAAETTTEVAQDVVQVAANELSKLITDGEFERIKGEEFFDRLIETGKEAALATPGTSLPFASPQLAIDLNKAKKEAKSAKGQKIKGDFTKPIQEVVDTANAEIEKVDKLIEVQTDAAIIEELEEGKIAITESVVEEIEATETAQERDIEDIAVEKRIEKLEARKAEIDIEIEQATEDRVGARKQEGLAPLRKELREISTELDNLIVEEKQVGRTKKIEIAVGEIRKAIKKAKGDVKETQANIVSVLKDSGLTLKDRGKFLDSVKNLKSIPEIQDRVTKLLEAEQKRNILNKINSTVRRAKKSKSIAVDFVDKIDALIQGISTTTPTEKTAVKLQAAADFLERTPGAQLPKTLLSKIVDMGKRPISEVSVSELEDIHGEMAALMQQGKTKLRLMKEAKKARQKKRLAEISETVVPLSNMDLKTAPLGETLSVRDKLKNIYIEGLNKAQRLNLNKNPMDVIFDIMDGFKEYQGGNSTVFKKTIDRSYNRFLNLKESVTRDVKNLADTLGLKEGNYNRIGVWAALQQEGGRIKLKNAGITEAEISSLKLTDTELQMYNLMREKLDSLRPPLKDVMRVVYNKDFGNVKDYFPFMTDFESMKDIEIQEMFGDDAFLISEPKADFNKKDVKKGFAEERVGGRQAVRIDALNVFLSHVENATYLIEMGQDIKELGELASSKEFGEMSGDLSQQITVDWIDLLARKGRVAGNIDFLDTIRVNTGAAILGFKLSSALIQPTALMDGASFVGGDYVARGVKNIASDKWRKFMSDNMAEIRERVGDDPNYLDMQGDGLLSDAREAGFWALKRLDLLAASSVASGAYIKSVEQRGGKVDLTNPDPIAIEEAQLAVRRTQSSAFAKDAPPIISQGKLTGNVSVDKLILQFQSFMLNRWSLIQHDFWSAGLKQGRTKKALNVATWLVLANMSENMIRHWTKELISSITGAEYEDDDELSEKIKKQAISNVPFVSSIVSSAEYGSVPVPAISLIESTAESLSFAGRSKDPKKKLKHRSIAAITGAGGAFGVPGTLQAKQLVQGAISSSQDRRKKPKAK